MNFYLRGPLDAGLTNPLVILGMIALVYKVYALVDAAVRRPDAYPAADRQNKGLWMIMLGLAVLTQWFFPNVLGIFPVAGLIPAIVYVVHVRPALVQVTAHVRRGPRWRTAGRW